MKIKHLALDIGNTLIEPVSGEWDITNILFELLDIKLIDSPTGLERIRANIAFAKSICNANRVMKDCTDEFEYFKTLYQEALNRDGKEFNEKEIEQVAYSRVYTDNIYNLIDPFFEYMRDFKTIRKGFFSNTYPSVIRFLDNHGMANDFTNNCLSFIEGVKKPKKIMFDRLIINTQLSPDEILLVDDNSQCITYAKSIGMKSVHFDKNDIYSCIREIENQL